jgi:hypothetical protein
MFRNIKAIVPTIVQGAAKNCSKRIFLSYYILANKTTRVYPSLRNVPDKIPNVLIASKKKTSSEMRFILTVPNQFDRGPERERFI